MKTRLRPYVANIHTRPYVIMLPEEPTSDQHCVKMLQERNLPIPERLPGHTTGPFVTKRAAQWVAEHPNCRFNNIAEAERMAKHYLNIEYVVNNYAYAI